MREATLINDDDPQREQRAIQSIEVGGRLLLALSEQPNSMSLKDLAGRAGLSASRAHPYLVSFGRLGLIEQDVVTGRYALGPAALQIGLSCLHQSDPLKAAMPVAESLAAEIRQSVVLAVWANFGPTIVRMIEGPQPLHVNMRVGAVMSILGTATGRAFAAVLPREKLERAMASQAGERPTPPIKSLDKDLADIAEEVRAHGVARAVGKPIPGVNAFSSPVFDHEGHAVLVITALGHQDSFASAWDSEFAAAVRQAAADVSRRLGHRPPSSAHALSA